MIRCLPRFRLFRLLALAMACGACVVSGCRTVPEEPPVEVSLVDFRFGPATVFETTATALVRVENARPEDIRVTGAAYRLELNGVKVGRGLSDATVAVPRLQSATTEVQVHLRNLTVVRLLTDLQERGVVEYRLEGTLYVASPGGRARGVPVSRSGSLDLRSLGAGQYESSR